MRATLVVPSPQSLQFFLGIHQIVEPVHIQAFVLQTAVERFDEGIVCGALSEKTGLNRNPSSRSLRP